MSLESLNVAHVLITLHFFDKFESNTLSSCGRDTHKNPKYVIKTYVKKNYPSRYG